MRFEICIIKKHSRQYASHIIIHYYLVVFAQIYGENHTKYLCTDLSHKFCVTTLADMQIFVRIPRIELHEWSFGVIHDIALWIL
jgi:hypothetical protein